MIFSPIRIVLARNARSLEGYKVFSLKALGISAPSAFFLPEIRQRRKLTTTTALLSTALLSTALLSTVSLSTVSLCIIYDKVSTHTFEKVEPPAPKKYLPRRKRSLRLIRMERKRHINGCLQNVLSAKVCQQHSFYDFVFQCCMIQLRANNLTKRYFTTWLNYHL